MTVRASETAAPSAACGVAFDSLADGYDDAFTRSFVGRELRAAVWARLDAAFAAPARILELGCGTGEDALRLAARGMDVVATDASERMIEVARAKARSREAGGRVEFRRLPMEGLDAGLGPARFDGVVANFGVVNCARDPASLVRSLAARLAPGAPLVWVVMGPIVPWEWAWYLARGDWRRASRRLRRRGVAWRGLTVRYPSPARLRALLRRSFVVERISPLGIALPPSYAAAWLERSPRSRALLARLERAAQRVPPLAWLSDHYIVEARRRDDGAPPPAPVRP